MLCTETHSLKNVTLEWCSASQVFSRTASKMSQETAAGSWLTFYFFFLITALISAMEAKKFFKSNAFVKVLISYWVYKTTKCNLQTAKLHFQAAFINRGNGFFVIYQDWSREWMRPLRQNPAWMDVWCDRLPPVLSSDCFDLLGALSAMKVPAKKRHSRLPHTATHRQQHVVNFLLMAPKVKLIWCRGCAGRTLNIYLAFVWIRSQTGTVQLHPAGHLAPCAVRAQQCVCVCVFRVGEYCFVLCNQTLQFFTTVFHTVPSSLLVF